MHNYHAVHGRLPPAVVYGKDGRPLYSWRVLLLPYFNQGDLFNEFRLDEPWDSPHNLGLLPRMPATYAPPAGKAWKVPPGHTVCKVFYGKGAAFEGREGLRLDKDLPDGTATTFLVVEAGEPVPWTKPEDLPFDPDGPLPDMRRLFDFGFRAGPADCSGYNVRKEVSEKTLRAAITRNGGETLGPDW